MQHIQTVPYRHVVAREQRTRECQRAEHHKGNQRRMSLAASVLSCGDVEHRVQRRKKQHGA